MELFKDISGQIQTNLSSNFYIRARYLFELYRSSYKVSKNKHNYIDIGCGSGVNSAVFGEEFDSVHCSDFSLADLKKCREYMRDKENFYYIAADAQYLPFKGECFDLVTAFSLIEHVPGQEKMLIEAFKILKKQGHLVLQFPNKHFFMELHTGIPFYCIIPDFLKRWILRQISYEGFIEIPEPEEVKAIIRGIDPTARVRVINVIYPGNLVPLRFRKLYSILKKTGIFKKIPFGWLIVCQKQ